MNKIFLKTSCALAMLAVVHTASAQTTASEPEYPCKMVNFIVPYPPGGSSDMLARMLAAEMTPFLNTTIVVENKAGAVGNIGTAQVSSAKPDGCTWLLGNSSNIVISRNLYSLSQDPVESLTPVAEAAAVPMVLYVNAEVPANTFQEFIELVRQNPGKYPYATPGSGSTHHILAEQLKIQFDLDATHIPYKGSGPAIQDVLAGHVAYAFEGTSAIAPHVASGMVRALATTSAQRSTSLPDVPTMKELGYPQFVATNWYGVFIPSGTPDELVNRLNTGFVQALKTPKVATSLEQLDAHLSYFTASEYADFVKEEIPRWQQLIQETGVKVD